MNGIGEQVLIDSQQPWLGTYESTTNTPVVQSGAPSGWFDKLLTTADKAIEAFNPNLNPPAPTPVAKPSWVTPLLIVGGLAAVTGFAYYMTKPKTKK